MVASINSSTSSQSTAALSLGGANASDAASMQDRFLKLLVAQINNQDPLSPMDNAQMTSQMAQINTVSGIQQVNETLQGLSSQFVAMQVLQASSLVGREVLVPGSSLSRDPSTGKTGSSFDLAADAKQVKVEILSPSGQVLDTIDAGAMKAGRQSFSWDASAYPDSTQLSYRVVATNDQQSVSATPYSKERVTAVGASNGAVSLTLGTGKTVPYLSVNAIL